MQTFLFATGQVFSKNCGWRRHLSSDGSQITREFLQLFPWRGAVHLAENFREANHRLLCEWKWANGGSWPYPTTCRKSAKESLQKKQDISWHRAKRWVGSCFKKPNFLNIRNCDIYLRRVGKRITCHDCETIHFKIEKFYLTLLFSI